VGAEHRKLAKKRKLGRVLIDVCFRVQSGNAPKARECRLLTDSVEKGGSCDAEVTVIQSV